MYLKQQEDLKCTEELYKEFYRKDPLDSFLNLIKYLQIIPSNSILNISANKKGLAPKEKIGFSHPIRVPSHNNPNK